MVTLGQQLKSRVIPQRPTRTQRLVYQSQYNSENANFQRLKAEAEAKGETIGQDVVEHYQERYISGTKYERVGGRWVKVNVYSTRDAVRMRPYTVTDYENFYNNLSDDIKPFFNSGEAVKQARTEGISKAKQQIIDKQTTLNQDLFNAKQIYDQKVAEENAYYNEQRRKFNNNQAKKDALKEQNRKELQRLEDKYNKKVAELQGFQTGLGQGLEELNKDQAFSYQDIERYAIDYANAEGQHERSHQEVSAFNRARQGYTPMLVTEYDQAGKPLSQEVYFQGKKGDIKEGTGKIKINANYDVKGLQEYEQKFSAPSKQTVELAGKKYNFNTSSQLFVDKQGDIVTHFGKTGYNRDVLRQDKYNMDKSPQFSDLSDKPFYTGTADDFAKGIANSPYTFVSKKSLGSSYGGQQSISSMEGDVLLPKSKKEEWKPKYDALTEIDERIHLDLKLSPSGLPTILSFGKREGLTDTEKAMENFINPVIDKLGALKTDLSKKAIGEDKILASEKEMEATYSRINQQEFDKKFMKDIIFETKTFEQALTEWESSAEYKKIQEDYQKEYGEKYTQLEQNTSFGTKVLYGTGIAGLSLAELGLGVVKSPTKTVLTVGALYGGYKVLGALGTLPNYVLGGYGVLQATNPMSSFEEVGAGVITAGVSFGALGLGAYSKLKKPIVKTAYKYPKVTKLRSSETIGQDTLRITKEGKGINRVIFNEQKLSQQGFSGKYKMVSNVGREWLRKEWNIIAGKKIINPLSKSKIPVKIGKRLSFRDTSIYKGIPTRQLPKVHKIKGLIKGVDYKFTLRKSGYQKALKSLTKYGGYTPAQAKARIRYTAPRISEQYLDRGDLLVQGNYARGSFEYSARQPKVVISKKLGITTRGGKPTNEINVVGRKAVIDGDKEYVLEKRIRGISKGNKGTMEFFEGRSKALKVKAGEGYDLVKLNKKLNLLIKTPYKKISSVSVDRRTMPFKNEFVISPSRTTLFNKLIDERSSTLGTRVTGGRKTPFSKTFGSQSDKQVQQIADRIVQDQTRGDIKQQLKAVSIPSQTTRTGLKLKSLVRGKNMAVVSEASLMKIGQLGSLKSFTGLKEESSMKSNLKLQSQLKNLLKEDSQLKSGQMPQLKTSPALSSKLRSLLGLKSTTSNVFSRPVIPRKPIPVPKPPVPKPFIMPLLNAEKRKGKKKSLKKMINELAYLPDFTSRSLGLTETVSQKQAQAKLKKLLTGFEIRRGVIIK